MTRAIDWKELVQATPLLAALPEPLRIATRELKLPTAAVLFNRGDKPRAMHFVASGEVRLVRQSMSGGEIVLQRVRRGFLAEASMEHAVYHCDAIAAEPSALLKLPRRAFDDALSDERFRKTWIRHLARELRRARTQAERLSLKSARERVIHYIETEGSGGSLYLSQTKKDWASELGLTHEALYRALTRMERDGQLVVDGKAMSLRG